MDQTTIDFVMYCSFGFFGLVLAVLIGICLWFIVPQIFNQIKHSRKRNKIRNNNFNFIKKFEKENPPTHKFKNKFDWEWHFRYKNNYANDYNWCSNCRYWVEINDKPFSKYCKGICKVKFKQSQKVESSTTYNDWSCKFFK